MSRWIQFADPYLAMRFSGISSSAEMKKVTMYHNPQCSKSRQTLALLEDAGASVQIVEYLKEPPTASALDRICKALALDPDELARKNEKRFRELNLDKKSLSRREWLSILSKNPILIERPIVLRGTEAIIGRPPENVLELL